ncbi:MAG: response regulator transcription factor [Jatrophihabitans sp.]|nr:MAG: response regulator transcription factor [Jatrophihabitans sp.]
MTEPQQSLQIFLVDDHAVVREGLADLLNAVPDFEVVGEAGTVAQALPRILAVRPDVAILDLRLPDGSGIDICRDVRSALPGTHCLILTSYDDQDALLSAVLAGASGYLLKEVRSAALIDGIRRAAMGHSLMDPALVTAVVRQVTERSPTDTKLAALTDREREVLDLIAEGLTNRQIGVRLFLAEKTVKNYVSSLLGKLGMQRRTQAAVFGAQVRKHA